MTPLGALAYTELLSPEELRAALIECLSNASKEEIDEAFAFYEKARLESWFEEFCKRYP